MAIDVSTGLLSGINNGLETVTKAIQNRQQLDLQKQQFKANLAEKGYQVDEDDNVTPGPLVAAQQQSQLSQYQPGGLIAQKNQLSGLEAGQGIQSFDPTSQVSQNSRAEARGFIKQSNPNASPEDIQAMVPEGMSANEIQGSGLLKSMSGGYGVQGQKARADAMGLMGQARMGQLTLAQNKFADQQVKNFTNDKIMVNADQRINQLDTDLHTINTAKTITPQMVHEISNGIASALAGGGATGLGQSERQDISTVQTRLASIEQNLSNSPEQGTSPEMLSYVKDTLARLKESYGNIKSRRADQLKTGRDFSAIPQAQSAMEAQYKAAKNTPSTGLISPQQDNGPKVGTIEGGYRFKGGNPADPKSWEKI